MRPTRSFLASLIVCTMLAPISTAQDPDPGQELAFQDASGDVTVGGVVPVPATSESYDLVSFRVHGEDQETLQFEIGIRNLKAPPPVLPIGGQVVALNVRFRLDGAPVDYQANVFVPLYDGASTGSQPIGASFCARPQGAPCGQQRVFARVDWDTSKVHVVLPKTSLAGQDPVGRSDPVPTSLPPLAAGTRLAEFVVSAGGTFPYIVSDRMPDSGSKGPYLLASGAANDRLQVRLASFDPKSPCPEAGPGGACVWNYPEASVSATTPSAVQIVIHNRNAAKRIVNVSTAMVDPADAAKFSVRIIGSVTIPGDQSRIVNLIVNVTGKVQHRDDGVVRVVARSLGFPDEVGALRLRLVAAVLPSPQSKDLFFHARGPPPNTVCQGGSCFGVLWLNTLEKDPRANADAGIRMRQSGGTPVDAEFSSVFRLDTLLAADLVLSNRDPVEAVLHFRTAYPAQQATVRTQLFQDEVLIGSGEAQYNAAGTTIRFLPLGDMLRISEGKTLSARVVLRVNGVSPNVFGIQPFLPEFIPQASKLTLPIVPDPKPKVAAAIPLGPAFISMSPKGSSEEFVNPGRVKVFEVTIVNEGVQEDVVKVTYEKDPKNWWVDLRPGASFRLKPGESATLGTFVKPPTGADEGDEGTITLNATSQSDPSALAQVTLTAIVTKGVEIEDEADNFTVDEDTKSRVEARPMRDAPGPGVVALGLVAATALLVGRVRRSR